VKPWGDYDADGAHVDGWVHQRIVASTALLGSIQESPMSRVVALLLLDEAMEYIDSAQVLQHCCNCDAPDVGIVVEVKVQVAHENHRYIWVALSFHLQDTKFAFRVDIRREVGSKQEPALRPRDQYGAEGVSR